MVLGPQGIIPGPVVGSRDEEEMGRTINARIHGRNFRLRSSSKRPVPYERSPSISPGDRLRELAMGEEERRTLFFTVDRARLLRTCSQINLTDFEE
jgi:hypothetical protein